jgi:gluconate 2-dehydrogenase alpha chain
MFGDAAKKLGYSPFPYPSGIASRAFTDRFGNRRAACIYCGFCTRFGCEVDAKSSPQTTHLPLALRTGRYEVRANSKVVRVNYDNDGRATGVSYIDSNGEMQEQQADIVLVSGFTLTNVRMLLVSRGGAHPDGIGNDRGRVGKNYTYQQFVTPVKGYFPGRRFNLYMGNGTTGICLHDFYGDNFDHSSLDFVGGAMMWSSLGERDPVTSAKGFPITAKGKPWGAEWKEGLRKQWTAFADIGFEGESLPYEDQFLDLDPVYRAADGQPLLRLTFDWHDNDKKLYAFLVDKSVELMRAMGPGEMNDASRDLDPYNIHDYRSTHPTGGAIMGSDPSNSVTNKYGQVWDTPNVFVTGAALYPQNPGANPTDTVAALAYMQGDAIRDRYMRHEGQLIA